MLKFFAFGFLSCFIIFSALILFLFKVVYPILEKSHHKASSERLYNLCQELIQR